MIVGVNRKVRNRRSRLQNRADRGAWRAIMKTLEGGHIPGVGVPGLVSAFTRAALDGDALLVSAPARVVLLTAALLLVAPAVTPAGEVYVDPEGKSGVPCSEKSLGKLPAPVCSIERALAVAGPRDTIVVRASTHRLSKTLWIDRPLKAYAGEWPVLDFAGQPADASFGVGVGIKGDGAILEGFEIMHSVEECVQTDHASNAVIRNNRIHDCGLRPANGKFQGGMQLGSDDRNILIEGNTIHDTGSHVLYIMGTGITVRNNLFYRPLAPGGRGSYGIQVGTSPVPAGTLLARNVVIAHNAIGESPTNRGARPGIVLYSPTGGILDSVKIVNNIFYGNAIAPVYIREGSVFQGSNAIWNNIFAGNGGCNDITIYKDTKDECVSAYPGFEVGGNIKLAAAPKLGWKDPASHDLHLLPASPAIDGALGGFAAADFDGVARPQGRAPDIGPFERAQEKPPKAGS